LIHPARTAGYQPSDFALATAADGALEITFTPLEREDLDVHLPARALFFFLPAGQATAIPGGPTITPALDAVAIQVLSMPDIVAAARAATNPPPAFAPWWVVEGIDKGDLLKFVKADRDEEDRQATAKGFTRVSDFRDALEAGTTSFNVSYTDKASVDLADPLVLTTVLGEPGNPVTVRVSTWYAWELPPTQYSTMPVSSSLAALGLLKPALAAHPLVVRAGSDLLDGDLTVHVAFQCWVPVEPVPPARLAPGAAKGGFQRMPAGTVVRLMKVATADPTTRTEVASGVLDATGAIEFTTGASGPHSIARASLATGAGEVLAFQVETAQAFVTQYQRDGSPRSAPTALAYGAVPVPNVWLTHGLASTTGEPGSLTGLDAHPGASLGQPSLPIVYNVGIPVFLKIEYVRLLTNAGTYATTYEPAPKGIAVAVTNSASSDLGVFRTDEDGEVWGLVTSWNPAAVDLRVRVAYQIEDRPPAGSYYELGLPRIDGVVQDADPPTQPVEDHFDSSWLNPRAPKAGRQTFGVAGPFSGASLGLPASAGLEIVQVGAINVANLAPGDWLYESSVQSQTGARDNKRLYGEHGGLIDALKTIRHAHEWWHQLTSTVAGATTQPHLQKTWRELFDPFHQPNAAADPGLLVRVITEANVTIRGGVGLVLNPTRFEMRLLHPGTWSMLKPRDATAGSPPLPPEALALLWNRGTVHHEFAHVVLMVAVELHAANRAGLTAGLSVYNNAYDPRQVERTTFTPLLEGVSNTLTLMTRSANGSMMGDRFGMDAAGDVLFFNFKGDAPSTLPVSAGKTKSDGAIDPRLGLFVPGALANAQWRVLAGAAPALELIDDMVAPGPNARDLKDIVKSVTDNDVRTLFQRVVWLPMLALSVPDEVAGARRRWRDFEGRRDYPTTYALMRHLANDPDCYPALTETITIKQKTSVRDQFGTTRGLAWHLWNQWPP
jgi:hypothetical protein